MADMLELVPVSGVLLAETAKAIKVDTEFADRIWLPKSQIRNCCIDLDDAMQYVGEEIYFDIPFWLAEKCILY